MNLLAALLVVVRYTLHNVKTFILVIYCVVLRISFANCIIVLLGLLMSAFGSSSFRTSSVLIIFLQFLWYDWRFFVPLPTGGVGAFMLEGVCVSPCSTSCDASAVSTDCLVVVWRLYTSYPETRLATFLQSSSTVPPLFLHSFTIKPLDLHWSHTGLTLEQHWTHHLPPPTHIPSHISHTLLPHLKALQRCSVAALHATFLNHRKHQYIFNYI